MRVIVLSLFPEIIKVYFSESMMRKATESGLLEYEVLNIRDFSKDKHRRVDDYTYGGGKGMILAPEAVYNAIAYSKKKLPSSRVVYMSAKGRLLTNAVLREYIKCEEIVILCGRYEGVDERIVDNFVDDELCIGEFVVTGGELPALMFIDALIRLKGLLKDDSALTESFSYKGGLLEYDQYTRPKEFMGIKVPEVLLSGNHEKIEEWRYLSSLKNTYEKRPELLKRVKLSRKEVEFLSNFVYQEKRSQQQRIPFC